VGPGTASRDEKLVAPARRQHGEAAFDGLQVLHGVVQLRNVLYKEKRNAMQTVFLAFTFIFAMGLTGVIATVAGVYVGETWLTCTRC
jgi:hypothetical protein